MSSFYTSKPITCNPVVSLRTYIVWFLIVWYVRSAGHVFEYLYTLDDHSERPMDYDTYLLPKVFPLYTKFP